MKKRSDEGRRHDRPFAEPAYSQGWNIALYQLQAQCIRSKVS